MFQLMWLISKNIFDEWERALHPKELYLVSKGLYALGALSQQLELRADGFYRQRVPRYLFGFSSAQFVIRASSKTR
jgi:hypothetical protein